MTTSQQVFKNFKFSLFVYIVWVIIYREKKGGHVERWFQKAVTRIKGRRKRLK